MKKVLKNFNSSERILLALSLFVLISLSVFTFTGSNLDFNSDVATANLLAEEMVRTGQYFPEDWVAGQDLWVFFLHTFIAFFTLFSDDYLLMRSLACMIFIAMALLSCIYCSRKSFKDNSWLIAVPLLFCGISPEYASVVFGQCAYITSFIYTFFFISLFTDSVDVDILKVKSKAKFIILLVLIAFIGFSGIRPLQIFGLPLIGAVIIYYFLNNYKEPVKNFLIKSKSVILILLSILVSIALGYIGFKYITSLINFSTGGTDIQLSDFDIFSRLKTFINLFIFLFGPSYNVPLMSLDGIFSVMKIVAGILLLVVFPIFQIRDYNKEEKPVQLFTIFAILHILEILILSIFGAVLSDSSRYLFTIEFLLLFLSSHYIYKKWIKDSWKILQFVSVLAMLIYIIPISVPKLTSFIGYDAALAGRRAITDYLKSQDLNYGYATYWNAANNTCYSNGEVEINNIVISDRVYKYHWLNSTARYDAFSGKSFLLLTNSENDKFMNTYTINDLGEPLRVEQYGDYWIYIYDYNISAGNFSGKYNKTLITQELIEKYFVENVYFFDAEDEAFSKSDSAYENSSEIELSGEIIISEEELGETAVQNWIKDNYELVGEYKGYNIYSSEKKLVDIVNGLPADVGTINVDYPYTKGIQNNCEYIDGKWIAEKNGACAFYGPYAQMKDGEYKITLFYDYIEAEADVEGKDVFDICINCGESIIESVELDPEENKAELMVEFSEEGVFEYRLTVGSESKIEVQAIEVEKID